MPAGGSPRHVRLRLDDRSFGVEIDGHRTARVSDAASPVESDRQPAASLVSVGPLESGHLVLTRGDTRTRAWVVADGDRRWVFIGGAVFRFEVETRTGRARARQKAPVDTLGAPMPATVVGVLVAAGQRVKRGEPLILLEAMKMELPLRAPHDGTVKSVSCSVGELVQPGSPLVELVEA